ncbi:hypothetical protein C3V36_02730 [Lachnospiraceae bacterium oral taxon 500]|nr:hypothetical protein C3V36_02730 [Lachnospiraceae bacterium oral taxon 500]
MLSIDRKSEIYNKFLQNKTLTIKKMAEELDVSEQTVRRDFKELEKAGIITMFYSGAKLNEKALPTINVDFSVRQKLTLREKEDMAKLIKDVFEEKDSIFLDNSSTVFTMIDVIKDISMTVVTNAIMVAYKFLTYSNVSTVLLGGLIDNKNKCTNDNICLETLDKYHFNKAFISCSSVSIEKGITDSNVSIAQLRRKVMENSETVYLLVDSTKFNKISLIHIDDFSHIDYLVTEKKPSEEWMTFLQEKEVNVIYPKE